MKNRSKKRIQSKKAANPPRLSQKVLKLFSLMIIIFIGILLYSNTFNSPFHFDDTLSIKKNIAIRDIYNLKAIWQIHPTRFVTYFSFALNYHFHKLDVFGYHLVNLMIHISSALLVWWFALLTFSTSVMKSNRISGQANLIALMSGLIFVVHPIQTQAVTYIVQRLASLATFFYLASLTLYIKARLLQPIEEHRFLIRIFYLGFLLTACLGMFTKEIVFTLPFTIILYDRFFLRTQQNIKWKFLLVFFVLAFIAFFTVFAYKYDFAQLSRQEAPGGYIEITPFHYLLTQFRVLITYLRLLFIPVNQNLDYDYPISKSLLEITTLSSLVFLGLIICASLWIYRRYRLLSFCVFWFFITLMPESSVVPIRDVIFEHRLYLPMVGFSVFFVCSIFYLLSNNFSRYILAILLIFITCYSLLTYSRNNIWRSEITLWNDVVNKVSRKARPFYTRAGVYVQKGFYDKAIADCNKLLEMELHPDAYNVRGIAYGMQEDYEKALADMNKAIRMKPISSEYYYNRGKIYLHMGDYNQAISDFNHSLRLKSNDDEIYFNRGLAFKGKADYEQAIADLSQALHYNPYNEETYCNRGLVFYLKGDYEKALEDFKMSLRINQNYAEAYNNMGLCFNMKGNNDKAITNFTTAITIKPGYAEAYNNRAVSFSKLKRYDEAKEDIQKALKLGARVNPRFLEYLQTVGSGK